MNVPYSSPFDLGGLSDRGAELVLKPTSAERAEIARWLGIEGVESLEARVSLSRAGSDRYDYRANFAAGVVQACVITLDPVRSHLSGEFHRSFELVPKLHPKRRAKAAIEPPIVALSTGDEDDAERLDNPIIDLAAPVLEELSLALDPYPRAPGAAFDVPVAEAEPIKSPFAVLEKLKQTVNPQSSKRPAKPKSRKRE
jgi:uncharacterized metal-binding protein YceD (DUF177 family)